MNIQEMMKQAKVMQDRMKNMQDELSQLLVEAQSGGGLVRVVVTCRGEVKEVDISQEVIDQKDKDTIQDLVVAAINAARQKAEEKMQEETQKMMKEFGLPPNMDLPQ